MMKWIFSLVALSLLSSCTTKPWMVGSVNDITLWRKTPGAGWKPKQVREEYSEYSMGEGAAPVTSAK